MGCLPSTHSHCVILLESRLTSPSPTLPPGAMTVTSAMRGGLVATVRCSSHLVISALRGSWRETALNWTLRCDALTEAIAALISSAERGSRGCRGRLEVIVSSDDTYTESPARGHEFGTNHTPVVKRRIQVLILKREIHHASPPSPVYTDSIPSLSWR